MKRLTHSGSILTMSAATDTETQCVRSALLVHSGPNGSKIEFQSSSGPISFDQARIEHVVHVYNKQLKALAKDYGGFEKIPPGAFSPLLDAHSDDSTNCVIGRLTAKKLRVEMRDIPKVGKNCACVVGDEGDGGITFLGKETVERSKDGRIFSLSIGINEEDDSIGELSAVIDPAAPGARVLSKNINQGGFSMSVQMKKEAKERLQKLSEMKDSLTALVAKADQAQVTMKLAQRKSKITHKLSALCQSAKLTPAELKTITAGDKLSKLAAMSDEHLDLALSIFASREASPIHLGQRGSTSASDVMDFGKKVIEQNDKAEVMKLKAEVRKDIKKMSGGTAKFSEHVEDCYEKKMASEAPKDMPVPASEHVVPGQQGEKELSLFDGNMGEAPDMQMQIDEVKTQMVRMAAMLQEMLSHEAAASPFEQVSEQDEQMPAPAAKKDAPPAKEQKPEGKEKQEE